MARASSIFSTVRCRRSCGINRTISTISSLTCGRIQSSHACPSGHNHRRSPFSSASVNSFLDVLSSSLLRHTRIFGRDFLITNANCQCPTLTNVRTLLVDGGQHFTIQSLAVTSAHFVTEQDTGISCTFASDSQRRS